MSAVAEPEARTLSAPHFVRGHLVEGDEVRYRSRDLGVDFTTPALDLDALITPRSGAAPAAGRQAVGDRRLPG